MSAPIRTQLVNPHQKNIDLSTLEGQNLYQKSTGGLPASEKHPGNSKEVIKSVEHIENYGEEFGWKTAGENFGALNMNVFKTLDNLTIDSVRAHCDPKWRFGSAQEVQLCILSNTMFMFINKSITQCVLDVVKDDSHIINFTTKENSS